MHTHRRFDLVVGASFLVGGLLFIVSATLSPFSFEFRFVDAAGIVDALRLKPSSLLDFPRNIILFFPFGFGLASLLAGCGFPVRLTFLLVVLGSLISTVSVETLQLFLPGRVPNLSDVLANSFGGATGGIVFQWWRMRKRWLPAVRRKASSRNVFFLAGVYYLTALLLAAALLLGFRPAGWDLGYPLVLGNEPSKDRPWTGNIRNLVFLDRAVNDAVASQMLRGDVPSILRHAVIADYPLTVDVGGREKHGRLPDLVAPVRGHSNGFNSGGAIIRDGSCLATEAAAELIAGRINSNAQFTVALTLAPSQLAQSGPSRIVTISQNPFRRNLTLGQEGASLVLRWRSPLTGKNGATFELQFPGIFVSTQAQRLILSDNGRKVSLFTSNGLHNEILLRPEAGVVALFHEGANFAVTAGRGSFWKSALIVATIVFLPLGFLLQTAAGQWPRAWASGTTVSTILVLTIIWEGSIAAFRIEDVQWTTVVFSIAAALVGVFLGSCCSRWSLRELVSA
jgi:VanZ family protein